MGALLRSLGAALVLAAPLAAQEALVSRGFEHFYNLEYDEAIADFSEAVKQHPDLPAVHNHLAQAILYRAMFRAGALESELVTGSNPFLRRPKVEATPEENRRFQQAVQKSMELCQARLRQNPQDPKALYALGVAHGWRANYNFLVRKAWRDALRDATNARKLHNKVSELDPSMIDARLMQGVHDYVVGSLPLLWKMLGFLIGFRGDKGQGIRTLELVAQKGVVNLERLKGLKQSGARGFQKLPWARLWYAEGNVQFWYNDLDAALENMKKATAGAEALDLNTGVLAWMRLGQLYDLKGQRASAQQAYRRAIAFAPASDAAAESRRYLNSPYRRPRR